ncbi:LytR/AlgR family response regulator transcription factor [Wenyingzhuangia sp. IMCC45574]
MKKDRLYFLTFISIALVFLVIASFAVKYFIKESANQLIELQLSSSVRECNEVSKLLYYQLEQGISKEKAVASMQQTIQNSKEEISFLSAFDWSGKQVCHPNITKVGQAVSSNQSLLNSLKEEDASDKLYDLLMGVKEVSKNNPKGSVEIVHIAAVSNSDLIVAAHMNLSQVRLEIGKLKKSFYTIFMLMGGLIILSSFLVVRIIGSFYEKRLEQKNSSLESEILNLSKLNTDLVAYQQKVEKSQEEEDSRKEAKNDQSKKRILTYIRNELVPIPIHKISFIYTENTITYVVTFDGKKSTTNASLDDLYASLDTSLFFRANRQFIISITSIQKIIKYGNSQLKILVTDADAEIIISKNKASEFRQWLNI